MKRARSVGRDKSVYIVADYLGAVKQMPFLVREMRRLMPGLKIGMSAGDYCGNTEMIGVLERDMKYQDIPFSRSFLGACRDESTLSLDFAMLNSSYSYIRNSNMLRLPVDPLKFEKRRLLSEGEREELRKRYGVRGDGQVVLGGSLHSSESERFLDASQKFLKKSPNGKIIIVPRKEVNCFGGGLSRRHVAFETDKGVITGDTSFLIIEEKGVLDRLYSICDIAVLGDSFGPLAFSGVGQNPLEPAFYGKKIIMGDGGDTRKYFDYEDSNGVAFEGLGKSGLLKIIEKNEDLAEELLRDVPSSELEESRRIAAEFIESRQGAAKAYAEVIRDVLFDKIDYMDDGVFYEHIKEKLEPFLYYD